jgi:hypothetical protein
MVAIIKRPAPPIGQDLNGRTEEKQGGADKQEKGG